MDKYEYNIKAEQIVKLLDKKDYATAAKIADGIDWRRVRNINMLINVGKAYLNTGRYEDAKDILLIAFDRAPAGRRLAYMLAEVCIEAGQFEEAELYYNDFIELAPRDSSKYELQYKLARKKGAPLDRQIAVLQAYKSKDFDDKWAYELAKLYHKADMPEECIRECDDIILWFGEGEYVEKAMELKMMYVPLTPSQQRKYDSFFRQENEAEQRENGNENTEEQNLPTEPVSFSTDIYNTADLQATIAEGMKGVFPAEENAPEEENRSVDGENIFHAVPLPDVRETDMLAGTKDLHKVLNALYEENEHPGEPEINELPMEEEVGEPEIKTDRDIETAVPQKPVRLVEAEQRALEERKEQAAAIEEAERVEAALEEKLRQTAEIEEAVAARKEIERARAETTVTVQGITGRKLSEERKKLFSNYLHMTGLEEQLAEVFDEAERIGEERETSLYGNILIIGEHKTGKTTIAVELMRALNQMNKRKDRKIAKISGDRLNNKGIPESIKRLIGADLLIERAGEMRRETVSELIKAMAGFTGGMIVILEDTQENMQLLMDKNPEISVQFTHTILLKECDIAEWVEKGREYAQELDYGIDEMAMLALSARLDSVYSQKSNIEMEDVKAIIDAAIAKSEKKNIKKLFDTVFSRKYKDSDLTMLREGDFE